MAFKEVFKWVELVLFRKEEPEISRSLLDKKDKDLEKDYEAERTAYFNHHEYLVESESESTRQLDQLAFTISSAASGLLLTQIEKVKTWPEAILLFLCILLFVLTILFTYLSLNASARVYNAEREDCVNAKSATYQPSESTKKLHTGLDQCNNWQHRFFIVATVCLLLFATVRLCSPYFPDWLGLPRSNDAAAPTDPTKGANNGNNKNNSTPKGRAESTMTENQQTQSEPMENKKVVDPKSGDNKGSKPRPAPTPPPKPAEKPGKGKKQT